jgi:hypothetical protein
METRVKLMKDRVKTFNIPVWDAAITVVVFDDFAAARGKYDKSLGVDPEPVDCHGCVVWKGTTVMMFLRRRGLSYGVLSHEATHTANRVLGGLGVPLKEENDEPFAYLCGWIVDRTVKWLNKSGEKIQ